MSQRFDAAVIGAGPGGEVAVSRLHEQGLSVALVERELIGGECAYWACIPSKTLLRAPEVRSEAHRAAGTTDPELRWREIADYRDFMIRHLDDEQEIESYRKQGIAVFKGEGRLDGPGRVHVGDQLIETDRIVLATGTTARIPSIDGLEQAGYWTNREATTIQTVPESVVILGGGPVGTELAQLIIRLGAPVTLIEAGERLLAREEPAVSESLAQALRDDGVDVRLGVGASSVARIDGGRTVELEDGTTATGAELVVATGRAPRVDNLGLESVGVEPRPSGIAIDERCRAAEGIWAIGDVTGVLPFTHVSKYQARIACQDIAGRSVRADYSAVPRVVFCDPEVAAVGLTAEQARDRGIDAVTAHVKLADAIARPWTYEREPRGELGVLADRARRTLIGAWAVSPLASEWIHFAALAIKTEASLDLLADTAPQFPTYSEGYLKAFEQLEL